MEELHEKTDEELVILTLEDREVFGVLIERYYEKLLRYIRRITNYREDDLKDILQETFIKAYSNLNSFDTSLKFSSWIYRIAHNQTISIYRKHSSRVEGNTFDIDDEKLLGIAADNDTTRDAGSSLMKERIAGALTKLDPKYREVLVLKFLEEKDYEEISDILQKPKGTVGTLINRAKKHLKLALEEGGINNENYEH